MHILLFTPLRPYSLHSLILFALLYSIIYSLNHYSTPLFQSLLFYSFTFSYLFHYVLFFSTSLPMALLFSIPLHPHSLYATLILLLHFLCYLISTHLLALISLSTHRIFHHLSFTHILLHSLCLPSLTQPCSLHSFVRYRIHFSTYLSYFYLHSFTHSLSSSLITPPLPYSTMFTPIFCSLSYSLPHSSYFYLYSFVPFAIFLALLFQLPCTPSLTIFTHHSPDIHSSSPHFTYSLDYYPYSSLLSSPLLHYFPSIYCLKNPSFRP